MELGHGQLDGGMVDQLGGHCVDGLGSPGGLQGSETGAGVGHNQQERIAGVLACGWEYEKLCYQYNKNRAKLKASICLIWGGAGDQEICTGVWHFK